MRSLRVALAALLLPLTGVAAYAALPTFWQTSTEADFLKGEFENLSLDSYGRLTLGPAATTVYESSAPFLWTLLSAPDGSIFVGTGNDGQVFRTDASGKTSLFFDAEELEVHALAAAPGGGLFVATSPDGKIYRVDATGKGSVFFDPPDKYIWSLVVDRSGNLFAATGDKGVIYKIPPDGKGAVFYQTKATHAMTLALDQQGRLLAGTESPGRVFQIDASGKPFVLLDSGYNEIHQIRVRADGSVFAAAIRGRAASSSATSSSDNDSSTTSSDGVGSVTVSVSTEVTGVAVADTSGGTTTGSTRVPVGPGAGAVFQITPDGGSETLWESHEDTPYDIAFDGTRDILIATGSHGKIYRLSGDPYQPTLVSRANAEQVTTLATDRNNRVLFATSNPGKVFRLGADHADRGTYTSDVRDGQTVSSWGVVKWGASLPSGTRVEVSTRSGNTRTPDETWSDWSSAYNNADGSQISSPRARYLQWRAVLVGSRNNAPLLTSVTAAYLPRNIRPRVTGITIHPPGTVFQRQFPVDPEIAGFEGDTPDRRALARVQSQSAGSSPSLGRRTYEKGLLTFVWHADDENHDTLSYEVDYRREGETAWKPLKVALNDTILVWDTTSVANGRYVIRIVASDAPSNSAGTALTGSLESTAFDVDNTPPAISIGQVRRDGARTIIGFEVKDGETSVQKAEYSLDGDRWIAIYPRDGIADSRSEQFELSLQNETGARAVIVRATDALNNVASKDVELPSSGGR
jgi:hypothetical protein